MRIVYHCADAGIPVLGYKGASVHVRAVTQALQARGHDVTLICARLGAGQPRPQVGRIIEAGVDEARITAVLSRVLAEGTVDLVIERYALASGVAGPLCARQGIAYILEVNSPIVLEAARHRHLDNVDARLRQERHVFESAQFVMVVSTELERYVRRMFPRAAVTVVPNGVDVERFGPGPVMDLGLPPGSVVIGFVGSMKPWHGVEDLVAASAPVLARHPEATLVLAGEGPRASAARDQVALLGLDRQVRFLGPVEHEQVPSLLRAFDVAAAPYRASDDFYFSPLKVLEYLASGCLTVYPEIGDLPGMIAGCGLAYPAGDLGGLEDALERSVVDGNMRVNLGCRGRVRALDFTWSRVVTSLERLVQPVGIGSS